MGADTGVGSVDVVRAVLADLGVVSIVEAESGVKGVRVRGDSSARENRIAPSAGVLPDRRRVSEDCLVNRGTVELCAGMTRGASCLGDRGCRG